MSASCKTASMTVSQQGFIFTHFFLFLGSSPSVLLAARDHPYPRQQEAKHSLFHRGVDVCDANRTPKTPTNPTCSWHKSATLEKRKTGVSSDISGLFLFRGVMALSASAVC